jgi:hypothetical protein
VFLVVRMCAANCRWLSSICKRIRRNCWPVMIQIV